MKITPAAAALTIATLISIGQAGAGVTVPAAKATGITETQAREIAWRNGLLIVEEIARMGYIWALAGRDREGHELAFDIDARDGAVLR
jgi:hypothetical protein